MTSDPTWTACFQTSGTIFRSPSNSINFLSHFYAIMPRLFSLDTFAMCFWLFCFWTSQLQHSAESLAFSSLDLARQNMFFASNKYHIFGGAWTPLLVGADITGSDKWLNCSVSQLLICCSVVKCPLDWMYVCTGSYVEIVDEMRYCGGDWTPL